MEMIEIAPRKISEGLLFGEGIRWLKDKIVMSDMIGERVVSVDPSNGRVGTLLEVPTRPNGLVAQEDGTLLILSMHDQKVLRRHPGGNVETYADLSATATGYLGDVVQHANGDLYVDDVGTKPFHGEALAPVGQLILVRPNEKPKAVLKNLKFPNGVVISPDGKRLYIAQSHEAKPDILVFDIDSSGELKNRRTLIAFNSGIDGLGIDDDEGIWPCVSREKNIFRVASSGEITHQIKMTGFEPISCSIGGEHGSTMCITAIESLEGKNIFVEMQAKRVRTSVFLVDVPFRKLSARP